MEKWKSGLCFAKKIFSGKYKSRRNIFKVNKADTNVRLVVVLFPLYTHFLLPYFPLTLEASHPSPCCITHTEDRQVFAGNINSARL